MKHSAYALSESSSLINILPGNTKVAYEKSEWKYKVNYIKTTDYETPECLMIDMNMTKDVKWK